LREIACKDEVPYGSSLPCSTSLHLRWEQYFLVDTRANDLSFENVTQGKIPHAHRHLAASLCFNLSACQVYKFSYLQVNVYIFVYMRARLCVCKRECVFMCACVHACVRAGAHVGLLLKITLVCS